MEIIFFLFWNFLFYYWVYLIIKSKKSSGSRPNNKSYGSRPKKRFLTANELIGREGERKIIRHLSVIFSADMMFRGVYIPKGDELTEVDVVALDKTGIYVIESKNIAGYVTGDVTLKFWRYTHPSGKRYQLYNPLFQNKTHVNAMENYLKEDSSHFMSYVVFGSDSTIGGIKGKMSAPIFHVNDIRNQVKQDMANRKPIYNDEQLLRLKKLFKSRTEITDMEREKHLQSVKRAQDSN